LLIFNALICCEENVKPGGFRRREKLAVLQSRQARVTSRSAVVTGQIIPEPLIDTFVDQNPHLRAGEQQFLRFFESGDRRLSCHGRKALEEVFECFAALQVVEQRLNRHTCPAKDGSPSEDVFVLNDDIHVVIVA